jgi:hypothetical protein
MFVKRNIEVYMIDLERERGGERGERGGERGRERERDLQTAIKTLSQFGP